MVRVPINVSGYVKKRLKSVAVTPDEAYNSILVRLLDCKMGDVKLEYSICYNVDEVCCVRVLIDWSLDSLRLLFYNNGVWSDEFPVNCGVDTGLWLDFKESVFSNIDFGVFALLEVHEFVVFKGLRIERLV